MKTVQTINVENYRKLVQTYIDLHVYGSALFWADKVVALTGNPRDVYWLAQCMYLQKQYHRAAHLLQSRNLEKTHLLCSYLTIRCLFEANEFSKALKVINSVDDLFFISKGSQIPCNSNLDTTMFDDIGKNQGYASFLLLKGKVLEAMDNRGLASDCYRQALQSDVFCFEAFDSLIKYQMLTAAEEEELLKSLPVASQCSAEESEILLLLYESKMKKYHSPKAIRNVPESLPNSPGLIGSSDGQRNEARLCEALAESLDLQVAEAERLYYDCDYRRCAELTDAILRVDPYHDACLPIHISCHVELKESNKLFSLAHNLVDLYPTLAISWFAVGCYYYIIGKSDCARRYLAKATCLDRLFGPAWLAFGHSFAVENEHDQAMAAYFKASQLMKGCHLPLLYIGLECGLTNNVRLADKFFQQAQQISPDDPFIIHEKGVICYQNHDFESAERHFKDAIERVKLIRNGAIPQRWSPLLNNLGHACRKLKKYDESLEFHKQALLLAPQSASTYSAIAYVHALSGRPDESVDWFHRALGLKWDDTFSTTMLNYVIEQLTEEKPPYKDCPIEIPKFDIRSKSLNATSNVESPGSMSVSQEMSSILPTSEMSMSMSMSIEVDAEANCQSAVKE